ncbi:hypothetical protein Tco_0778185, partial [Tanacetum coccineum]
ALITNDFGDGIATRDIVVDSKDGGPKWISELHPSYMALQYPMLFPYREDTRNNLDTLRVDLYYNLNDAVTRGDTHAEGLGKRIVLPKSFIGSPRYTMQNYEDAMALCQAYRNLDLFITFTSNPKWPEITEKLALIPEIPCPTDDLEGYKVVNEFMLHGPCGKGAACTVEGKFKGKFTYDKKYVVPYNRYLLLRYQAHINMEWCNRSKAIKYLFKYLNKGPDRATIVIQENVQKVANETAGKVVEVDEIKNNLNCRYLVPCEAVWRLFSFDIHYSYPSIMKLNFYLKDQNAITLRDSQNLPALLESEDIKLTIFTEWFELNKRDTDTRKITYDEIPKGPQYFKELMTVNDRLYATFKEACFAYGLLNDDKEWAYAISKASSQLQDILHKKRKLFKYPELQLTDEQLKNYCLLEIEALLNRNGISLTDFLDLP